ncbi:NAD(+) diphosphatase [Granulosicoccaceae sp. 1_MG-2023]|nr:NAD(+) diphosphatase [Granulosicoccaceae sp. 1_MG-2023]
MHFSDHTVLTFAGNPLDRRSDMRQDPATVQQWFEDDGTRIIPYWRNRVLVDHSDKLLDLPVPRSALAKDEHKRVYLGHSADGRALFLLDLSHLEEAQLLATAQAAALLDLREAAARLSLQDSAIAGFSHALMHWHKTHRFCGRCGTPTVPVNGGHMRLCSNSDCAMQTFPRTDTCVIMLVTARDPHSGEPVVLLGNHPRFPPGVYSTLAGFVDPGESLEEAVIREVGEEAGIRVRSPRYIASQPWPFPAQLMVGFTAEAVDLELHPDPAELTDARWFSADELRRAGDWGDSRAALQLPRAESIARFLIQQWLAGQS